MSDFRLPGPVCGGRDPVDVNDGTLPRWRAGAPGPVCRVPGLDPWPGLPDPWLRDLFPSAPLLDASVLFHSCRWPERGLSDDDLKRAAEHLKVEVETIQAVAEVETSGEAFDDDGRPRILFERHYFHKLTHGRWDHDHPRISQKSAGGYGKFSIQYAKLEEAWHLDPEAALRSASWGRFQIMGNNFRAAGHVSVEAFVDAHARRESAHLDAFVAFVGADRAKVRALQQHDWTTFAKLYNGPGYAKNQYDVKMKNAHERLVAARPKPHTP